MLGGTVFSRLKLLMQQQYVIVQSFIVANKKYSKKKEISHVLHTTTASAFQGFLFYFSNFCFVICFFLEKYTHILCAFQEIKSNTFFFLGIKTKFCFRRKSIDFLRFSFNILVDVIRNTDPSAQGMFNSGSGSESNPDQLRNTQKNSANSTMSTRSGQRSTRAAASSPYPDAYVKITEQPAPKALRFRYECEGRSAGSIPGANSTSDNKTYPSIQVVNYRGRAVVVVSCVTKEQPYR